MTKEIATVEDFTNCLAQGEFQWWTASATGIAYKDDTPAEIWRTNTQNLVLVYQAMDSRRAQAALKVGDSLNWGKEHLGEEWSQVIDATSKELVKSMSTLGNWMDIARMVLPSRRRDTITTIETYKAVAKLEGSEQDEFLKLADEENLTIRDLREKIKERHPRKERASKVTKIDNEQSALQKLIDVDNFLKAQGRDFSATKQWKGPAEGVHKFYRRNWQSGHKKA